MKDLKEIIARYKTTNKVISASILILVTLISIILGVIYLFILMWFILIKEGLELFKYIMDFYKIYGIDILLYITLPMFIIYCLANFYLWIKNKYEKR